MKGLYDDLTQLGAACIGERQAAVAAVIRHYEFLSAATAAVQSAEVGASPQ